MKVLFLCMHMNNGFHGSIMHILEYAEFFLKRKDEVYIAAVFISDEIRNEAERLSVRLFNIDELPLDITYDLVFVFHIFIFPALLQRGLKYKYSIATVLSKSTELELLPPTSFWPQFDLITCVSNEIINNYKDKFGFPPSLFTLIPNHVPINFLKYSMAKRKINNSIKKVCVVSNHYVEELVGMSKLAQFKTDFYGHPYGTNTKISPEILLDYDVVITIGKTIQYAMSLGIPVFEYDKFGGCGYITCKNLDLESETNFSGRGTLKKMIPDELLKEVENNYNHTCATLDKLKKMAIDKFSITSLIDKQIKQVIKRQNRNKETNVDAYLFANASNVALKYITKLLAENAKPINN